MRYSVGSGTRPRELQLVREVLVDHVVRLLQRLLPILREYTPQRRPEELPNRQSALPLPLEDATMPTGHRRNEGVRMPTPPAFQPVTDPATFSPRRLRTACVELDQRNPLQRGRESHLWLRQGRRAHR